MAEHLKPINPDRPPDLGPSVMTETAADILRSLHLVENTEGGAMTMIAGAPGVGKSETLLRFVQSRQRRVPILHTAVAAESSVWSLATGIMQRLDLGEPNGRRLAETRGRIAEAISLNGMLIVDEAQNLAYRDARSGRSLESFEWLRAMAEEGMFSLVLCGDLKLLDCMADLPQLRSRMRRPVVVRQAPAADVHLVARREGVAEDAALAALATVARQHGGLRDVVNVIEHARVFARGGVPATGHTCFDGQFFFDTDHPVEIDGQVTTVANTDGGAGAPWFLLDTSRAIRPLIWQEREAYEFQQITRSEDEYVFKNDHYLYGLRARVPPANTATSRRRSCSTRRHARSCVSRARGLCTTRTCI